MRDVQQALCYHDGSGQHQYGDSGACDGIHQREKSAPDTGHPKVVIEHLLVVSKEALLFVILPRKRLHHADTCNVFLCSGIEHGILFSHGHVRGAGWHGANATRQALPLGQKHTMTSVSRQDIKLMPIRESVNIRKFSNTHPPRR